MNNYVGEYVDAIKVITDETVKRYAELSGDYNPIHLDEDYAKKTTFKKKIAHGMLIGGYISKIIGMQLPGNGAIYLSQNFKFVRPVFIGDRIRIHVEIVDIIEDKYIILETKVFNEAGKLCVDGEAKVKKEGD